MILLIDNYDSFTYNLKQYLEELSQKVTVVRNDAIEVDDIIKINPSHLIISPGPGRPEDAGISIDVIKKYSGKIPILGVCLGHQSIGSAFGADIISAKKLMHGKISKIDHNNTGVFIDIPKGFEATRYHSLAIDRNTLPAELEVTAYCEDGEIMGVKHKQFLTEGVQFHPESILTGQGKNILKNFLEYSYASKADGMLIKNGIQKVIDGEDLNGREAEELMLEVMEGRTTDAQLASFLTALRLKGETVEEVTAFANVMREKAIRIHPDAENLVDTCGTGGDSSGTFNISTAAAIVTAAAGIHVAKHGNRSISSQSGSADVLESLNVNIDLKPEDVKRCIDEIGIGFLFAPKLHPAMKYAIGPRREMGIRTVFNILGPLTNPASASYQVLGVYSKDLVDIIAGVLYNLGIKAGYVVSSEDGLDEISISAPTYIAEIKNGEIKSSVFSPEDIGVNLSNITAIKGGTADENAEIITSIFNAKGGPAQDIVCINAGFAIAAVRGIEPSEGVKMAVDAVKTGKAKIKLQELKDFSNSL